MFDQAFDSLKKATETSIAMQTEMFNKWVSMWPGTVPTATASWGDQVQKFQKRWAETVNELVRRQRELMETQFKAGMQNIEKAFQLGEVHTVEELRARTVLLWQKCFESMKEAFEAQTREFQTAMEKWVEMTSRFPT